MNFVCLSGRLTRSPEIRYTTERKPVATFSLAVERNYKDSNGERPVDFLDCVVWNGGATYLERYANKGDKLAVTGRVQIRKWQTRDGENRYKTEIVCDSVEVLSKPKGDYARSDVDEQRPRQEYVTRQQDSEPGSGYDVYTPPGLDEMDSTGLPL